MSVHWRYGATGSTLLHQADGRVVRSPGIAGRADSAALAAEGHQPLLRHTLHATLPVGGIKEKVLATHREKLRELDFGRIAGGHAELTVDAKPQLERPLGRPPS